MPKVEKLTQGSGTWELCPALPVLTSPPPAVPPPLPPSASGPQTLSLSLLASVPLPLSREFCPPHGPLSCLPGTTFCSLAGGRQPSAPRPPISSCSSLTCCLNGPPDPLRRHPLPETGPSPGPGPPRIVRRARGPCPLSSPFWMASPGLTQMMFSRSRRAAAASTLSACGRRPGVGLAGVGVHLPGSPPLRLLRPTPTHPTPSTRRCPRPACCRSSAHAAPR